MPGLIIGFCVLYFILYWGVGRLGAGVLVDILNQGFERWIIPGCRELLVQVSGPFWLMELLLGEYGVITLGIRYATAIILPVVGIFFLCFAFLEDCGYLPRLAVVFDRFLHGIGLNGRAVIPLFLGLGCGTLAVMSTRTLERRRERILATFLLALSIPCSAQLGLVVALLSHKPDLLLIWLSYILGIFFMAGWIGAILLPGRRSLFFMEIPPMRRPRFSNMLRKTGNRILWYFFEVLPVFISLSILLCVAKFFGWLNRLLEGLIPVMQVLGLPPETATAFLMGFIRRDYGTAGLYDLFLSGKMNDRQLVVSCIVFTLFLPCLAQFAVMIKERGLLASLAMTVIILMISFGSGCLLKILLN